MNHPNDAELTDFLYGDLPPALQTDVAAHVEACEQCSARVDSWRDVRGRLASWKLPAGRPTVRRAVGTGALRWAAAAAVFLAAGYGAARFTAKPVDVAALRSELAGELRNEVRQELTTELARHAANQSADQQQFQQAMVAALERLEARQLAVHASLRKDVETVAVRTQEEFARLTGFENPRVQ